MRRPLVAALLVLASYAPARAARPSEEGLFRSTPPVARRTPALTAVETPSGARFVRVGAAVSLDEVALFATDNENTRYQLFVRYPKTRPCGHTVIRLRERMFASSGFGEDDRACSASFVLDAAMTGEAARVFAVSRRDRAPIGERVTGSFRTNQSTYDAGAAIEITLDITNPSNAPAVVRVEGGRDRGARDNRFAFEVTRDGTPVAPVEMPDFGGISYPVPLSPGETTTLRASLGAWASLTTPGTYEVRARYETELLPPDRDRAPGAPAPLPWSRTFTGILRFTVR
jgi:hypothetical protein